MTEPIHQPSPGSAVLKIDAAAEYLGTTPRHVRRLYSERRIPFVRVGKFVRFRASDLEAYLDAHAVEARR